MCTHQSLVGSKMGINSKLWQLKTIAIETDHREPTCGLVLTPWLIFLWEVPDTLSLAHPAVHWCHRPQVILDEKVSFGAVGGVIRVINCRGAVKSVWLKTLRRSEYRPAKSASRPKCARRASDIHISSRKQYINLSLLGGILGQNLKNQSRRSNRVRTSLDPKWPAESICAIARSYR